MERVLLPSTLAGPLPSWDDPQPDGLDGDLLEFSVYFVSWIIRVDKHQRNGVNDNTLYEIIE